MELNRKNRPASILELNRKLNPYKINLERDSITVPYLFYTRKYTLDAIEHFEVTSYTTRERIIGASVHGYRMCTIYLVTARYKGMQYKDILKMKDADFAYYLKNSLNHYLNLEQNSTPSLPEEFNYQDSNKTPFGISISHHEHDHSISLLRVGFKSMSILLGESVLLVPTFFINLWVSDWILFAKAPIIHLCLSLYILLPALLTFIYSEVISCSKKEITQTCKILSLIPSKYLKHFYPNFYLEFFLPSHTPLQTSKVENVSVYRTKSMGHDFFNLNIPRYIVSAITKSKPRVYFCNQFFTSNQAAYLVGFMKYHLKR